MTSPFISTINQLLSFLVVGGQIIAVVLLLLILFYKKSPLLKFVGENGYLFAFIVSLTAMSGSLFYSEVAGFTPCVLCWYQRILMYPQAILLAVALWKGDRRINDYLIVLSAIGALIATYHYFLQIGVLPELPCSVTGFSVSCSQVFIMNLGYITIPMMALTAFLLLILLALINKKIRVEPKLKV